MANKKMLFAIQQQAPARQFSKTNVSLLVLVILYCVVSLSLYVNGQRQALKVGILLTSEQDEEEAMFRFSVEQANDRILIADTKLIGLVKRYNEDDIWSAEIRTCELIDDGVIAIVGPTNGVVAGHVGFICDSLDIPHFTVTDGAIAYLTQVQTKQHLLLPTSLLLNEKFDTNFESLSTVSVDMSFSRHTIFSAMFNLIDALNMNDFVYLYEDDDSVFNFQEHFHSLNALQVNQRTNIRVFRFANRDNYRHSFWIMKQANFRHFILDIKCSNIINVMKQAQQVSMMTDRHSFLLTCLDMHSLDYEDFRYSRARILWFKQINSKSQVVRAMRNSLQQQQQQQQQSYTRSNSQASNQYYSTHLNVDKIKSETALIHDAVQVFAASLVQILDSNSALVSSFSQAITNDAPLSCADLSRTWIGSSLVNYLRSSITINGLTGNVSFTPTGHRAETKLQLMRLTIMGARHVGEWVPSSMLKPRVIEPTTLVSSTPDSLSTTNSNTQATNKNSNNNNNIKSTTTMTIGELGQLKMSSSELLNIRKNEIDAEPRDVLIVTSIKNEPFFMNKPTTKIETGNKRFEGYAIDLIDELSRIVGFDYVFKEVDDGNYGRQDKRTREWNGLIGEVMAGKADLAIADLSITSAREDAVDFTLPFMNTGISILFKKPTTKELELFSFLSPFEGNVWIYVCGAYITVSLFLFVVGRISPYEWADPHPCRQEGKILRNQFSVANSFWFTIAALMQQGSDLAPRSLSTRLISATWYFFTLIMISSYTANLAAFLTVEKVVYPIERAEDLYQHPQKIQYGCVESGSTATFFQNSKPHSTFRKMYNDMVFAKSNEEGRAKVEEGNYAFFMESAAIAYKIERHCNLTQIGGLLDSKGYGIALGKNSTKKIDYRTKLSEGILSLQESGTLEVLRTRWWKEKRGGGACDIDDSQSGDGVKELTLENVGGVFVVLLMGVCGSLVLCSLELYERCRRESKASGLSKIDHFKRRLKFALALSDNY